MEMEQNIRIYICSYVFFISGKLSDSEIQVLNVMLEHVFLRIPMYSCSHSAFVWFVN